MATQKQNSTLSEASEERKTTFSKLTRRIKHPQKDAGRSKAERAKAQNPTQEKEALVREKEAVEQARPESFYYRIKRILNSDGTPNFIDLETLEHSPFRYRCQKVEWNQHDNDGI